MGMFDWYTPLPPVPCPWCGRAISEWQGKDGPCAMLVYEQGRAAPVEQRVSADCQVSIQNRDTMLLPSHFRMIGSCCSSEIHVEGESVDGVWLNSMIVDLKLNESSLRRRRPVFTCGPVKSLPLDPVRVARKERRVGHDDVLSALQSKVPFVLANVGDPFDWYYGDARHSLWRSEIKPRLLPANSDAIYLENWPDGRCYAASQWSATGGQRVILFELYH
ncbi:MAG: hypothetical protein IBJ18_07150 [Phycisphaerales bacterium]|nr:hypothetical protein [Phycisphaerales bacterium]